MHRGCIKSLCSDLSLNNGAKIWWFQRTALSLQRKRLITLNILNMVQAKNYKNKDEVIADFKKAFARKREWLEQAERELAEIQAKRKLSVV